MHWMERYYDRDVKATHDLFKMIHGFVTHEIRAVIDLLFDPISLFSIILSKFLSIHMIVFVQKEFLTHSHILTFSLSRQSDAVSQHLQLLLLRKSGGTREERREKEREKGKFSTLTLAVHSAFGE